MFEHSNNWKVVKSRSFFWTVATVVCGILLMLLLLLLSFVLGKRHSGQTLQNIHSEVALLKNANVAYRAQISELRQQITSLTVGSSVDRQANEQLRKEMVSLQTEIDGLEANVRYYRRLMAPELDARGLQIGDVNLELLPDGKQVRFRIMTHQISQIHQRISGWLSVYVVGNVNGETKRVSLHELSSTLDSEKLSLRFKYFKIFEGVFEIPTGWEVHQLELEARSTAPEKKTVNKRVNWPRDRSA